MGLHLPQVAIVADVVSDAVLIHVGVLLILSGEFLSDRKGLQDGAGVSPPSTKIVNLGNAWSLNEGSHEAGYIQRVDVIADLFPLVAEYPIFLLLEVTFHEVAEESVEFDAGVVRTSEASTTKAAGGHAEVAAILLNHHVGSNLGSPKERMLALVDREVLRNAVRIDRIGVVPAGLEFLQRNSIWAVAIDFIRRHMDEGGVRAGSAGCFEHVESTDGVGVKVVKWDCGRTIMAGLGRSVDDDVGLNLGHEVEDPMTVSNVEFVMGESLQVRLEALLVPPGITLGAEEYGALVVINSLNLVAEFIGKIVTHLGADKARGSSDKQFFSHDTT